jgi:hypothetical protein
MPLCASTFIAMDTAELAQRAGAVVEGSILRVDSFWNEDGTVIVSEAQIEVRDVLSGEASSVVVVRTFGGEVGGYRVEAHGFPKFERGQDVLLFLEPEQDGHHRVAGYQLGHYLLRTSAAGLRMALPTLDPGVTLLRPDGRAGQRPVALPLDQLRDQIRALTNSQQPDAR